MARGSYGCMNELVDNTVIPAKAGIQKSLGTKSIAGGQHLWIPAFAGIGDEKPKVLPLLPTHVGNTNSGFKLTNLGTIFTIIAGCGDFKRISTNRLAVSDYAGDSRPSAVD